MYESDNNTNPGEMYSTSTSSNVPQFKKFNPEKPIEDNADKTTNKDIEYNYMESVQIQINENIIRL